MADWKVFGCIPMRYSVMISCTLQLIAILLSISISAVLIATINGEQAESSIIPDEKLFTVESVNNASYSDYINENVSYPAQNLTWIDVWTNSIDLIELIKITSSVNIAISIGLLLTIPSFVISLKYESIDAIAPTAFMLTLNTVYALLQGLLILLLIMVQWRNYNNAYALDQLLLCISASIQLSIFIVCAIALIFVVCWYKMVRDENGDEFVCLGRMFECIKRSRHPSTVPVDSDTFDARQMATIVSVGGDVPPIQYFSRF